MRRMDRRSPVGRNRRLRPLRRRSSGNLRGRAASGRKLPRCCEPRSRADRQFVRAFRRCTRASPRSVTHRSPPTQRTALSEYWRKKRLVAACTLENLRERAPGGPTAPAILAHPPLNVIQSGKHTQGTPSSVECPAVDPSIADTVRLKTPAVAAEKYFVKSATSLAFEFGAATHRGLCRAENQDHYIVVRRRRTQDLLLSSIPEGEFVLPPDES